MLNAVCRNRHEMGNYNDDAVYEYLEYLRTNGINMAFRKKEEDWIQHRLMEMKENNIYRY